MRGAKTVSYDSYVNKYMQKNGWAFLKGGGGGEEAPESVNPKMLLCRTLKILLNLFLYLFSSSYTCSFFIKSYSTSAISFSPLSVFIFQSSPPCTRIYSTSSSSPYSSTASKSYEIKLFSTSSGGKCILDYLDTKYTVLLYTYNTG